MSYRVAHRPGSYACHYSAVCCHLLAKSRTNEGSSLCARNRRREGGRKGRRQYRLRGPHIYRMVRYSMGGAIDDHFCGGLLQRLGVARTDWLPFCLASLEPKRLVNSSKIYAGIECLLICCARIKRRGNPKPSLGTVCVTGCPRPRSPLSFRSRLW